MDFFRRIAENRILEAIEAGEFDNLQGKGQPLDLEDDSYIPPELRMAYKILKNADCLPPELELRQEVVTLQDLVASMEDEAEKLQADAPPQLSDDEAEHDAPGVGPGAGARPLHPQDPGTPGIKEIASRIQP